MSSSEANDDSVLIDVGSSLGAIKTQHYFKMGLSLDGGGIRGMLLAT